MLATRIIQKTLPAVMFISHHDDHGHGGGGHVNHLKIPMPWLESTLIGIFPEIRWVDSSACAFELPVGAEVKPHRDKDYVADGVSVTHGILIYLNDDYQGGHTFVGDDLFVKPPAGTALLFNHSVIHGSHPVTAGVKRVIKVDCACWPQG